MQRGSGTERSPFADRRRGVRRKRTAVGLRDRRLGFEALESRLVLNSTISGSVWEDANGNGVRDYREIGIAGVQIYLDLDDSGTWDVGEPTKTTASDDASTGDIDEAGTYKFDNLVPGVYIVRQTDPDESASFPDPQLPLIAWEQLTDGGVDWQGNPISGLDGAKGIAISPDGLHVYVTGSDASAVTVFRRDLTTGHLTFVESLQNGGKDGAGQTIGGIGTAIPITISSSGEHVYVGGRSSNAIASFQRDTATGQLTFLGYVADGRQDGAGSVVDGLNGTASLALSPDGLHVYAAGTDDDAIAVFERDPTTGSLTYATCYKDGDLLGSGAVLDGLDVTTSVVVSNDGQYVYASGYADDSVVVFARDETTGELTWVETLQNSQPDGSGQVASGLDGPYSVTLTADGTEAIVASRTDDAIVRFHRDVASGKLSFIEEISGKKMGVGFDYPMLTALSPEDDALYVPSAHAFVSFHRDSSNGRMTFQQVLGNDVEDGQGQLVSKLDIGFAAATTADGKFVYGTASTSDTLTVYYRSRHPGAHVVEVESNQGYEGRDFGQRPSTGNQILYIITEYPDRSADISESLARYHLSLVNEYYVRNSYGKQSYPQIIVTPPLMMPHELAWYDPENNQAGLTQMWSDATAAAVAAGYDPTVSRHTFLYYDSFVYNCKGSANLPGTNIRISCVQSDRVTAHEMGHNLGLTADYYWNTGDTSIIGPGQVERPGNFFSPMGSSELGDFTLYDKKSLGWLDDTQVPQVSSSGTYTIQAMDRGIAYDDQGYGFWLDRGDSKEYWIEFRQGVAGNKWSENGILVYWKGTFALPVDDDEDAKTIDTDVLLDMTPESADGINDSPLLIGRTFSDNEAGTHITPVARHETFPESIDVVVNLGQFLDNQPPTAALAVSHLNAFVGETTYFRDKSVDPNGHELANFWSFGDGTWQTNRNVVEKLWSQPGEYQVQLEVTDMHGGTDVIQQTITVTSPSGPYLRLLADDRSLSEGSGMSAGTLTVARRNADTSEPLVVTLNNSDPSELAIQGDVTIPAGEASITIPVDAVDDLLPDGTQTVSIEAVALGYLPDTLNIDVLDDDVAIVPPTDLGTIDFHELSGLDLQPGDLWYQLTTTRAGQLTALASADSGTLSASLYDQTRSEPPLAHSNGGSARLDHTAQAGETYLLKFSGSSDNVAVTLANLVNAQGTEIRVFGTSQADQFEFVPSGSYDVSINSVEYQFDNTQYETFVFTGGEGDDTATLTGGVEDEIARFFPDHGTFGENGFLVTVDEVVEITAHSGGGLDAAFLYDSAGDDEFVCRKGYGKLSGEGFVLETFDFMANYGYATTADGGTDVAYMEDAPENDKFKFDWPKEGQFFGKMYGGGVYYNRAKNFEQIEAVMTEGKDRVRLFDSEGDDVFYGQRDESSLIGVGFDVSVSGYDTLAAYASVGMDVANFEDSEDDDSTRARSHKITLWGGDDADPTYEIMARRFDEYKFEGKNGGYDRAKLHDTALNDHVSASGNSASLYQNDGERDLLYEVVAFEWVRLYASEGEDTMEKVEPLEFELVYDPGIWGEV